MVPDMAKENRVYPRISFCDEVEYHTSNGEYTGEAANISLGGMLIRGKELPAPDTTIHIVFKVPSSHHVFRITSTVIWVSPDGTHGADRGMGIRFDDMSKEDMKRLMEYIASMQLTQRYPGRNKI